MYRVAISSKGSLTVTGRRASTIVLFEWYSRAIATTVTTNATSRNAW